MNKEVEKYYGELEKRCSKCDKLLFKVENYMWWAKKLTINVKCPRCGGMNHVTHHDFNEPKYADTSEHGGELTYDNIIETIEKLNTNKGECQE